MATTSSLLPKKLVLMMAQYLKNRNPSQRQIPQTEPLASHGGDRVDTRESFPTQFSIVPVINHALTHVRYVKHVLFYFKNDTMHPHYIRFMYNAPIK